MSELHSSESLHISAQKGRGKKKTTFIWEQNVYPSWVQIKKPTFYIVRIISFPSQFYCRLYEPCRDLNVLMLQFTLSLLSAEKQNLNSQLNVWYVKFLFAFIHRASVAGLSDHSWLISIQMFWSTQKYINTPSIPVIVEWSSNEVHSTRMTILSYFSQDASWHILKALVRLTVKQ